MYEYVQPGVAEEPNKEELAQPLRHPLAGAVAYAKAKAGKRQQAINTGAAKPWDSCEYDWYSSEEDEDGAFDVLDKREGWAWDEARLLGIQLDAVTILKSYVKLTVTNTSRKED